MRCVWGTPLTLFAVFGDFSILSSDRWVVKENDLHFFCVFHNIGMSQSTVRLKNKYWLDISKKFPALSGLWHAITYTSENRQSLGKCFIKDTVTRIQQQFLSAAFVLCSGHSHGNWIHNVWCIVNNIAKKTQGNMNILLVSDMMMPN